MVCSGESPQSYAAPRMHEVTPENAVEYLRARGRLPDGPAEVEWLAWGVSNVVLRVQPAERDAFVVKQSRAQLRTKAEWFSRLDRICREMDVMAALFPLLPAGTVPRILFEDRDEFLFGMEAVDASHVVWKQELLDGRADLEVAAKAGAMLAAVHRETFGRGDLAASLGDREVFDQLRLDPFYRRVASVHADLKPALDRLIDETTSRSDCLVHADFSPKNLLLVRRPDAPLQVALVDYETGHFGDPAFDLGFFFSHLLLKTVLHEERCGAFLELVQAAWKAYRTGVASLETTDAFSEASLDRRACGHLGGCLLARIDGKSTIDYLPDQERQETVRRLGRTLLRNPPARFGDVLTTWTS